MLPASERKPTDWSVTDGVTWKGSLSTNQHILSSIRELSAQWDSVIDNNASNYNNNSS